MVLVDRFSDEEHMLTPQTSFGLDAEQPRFHPQFRDLMHAGTRASDGTDIWVGTYTRTKGPPTKQVVSRYYDHTHFGVSEEEADLIWHPYLYSKPSVYSRALVHERNKGTAELIKDHAESNLHKKKPMNVTQPAPKRRIQSRERNSEASAKKRRTVYLYESSSDTPGTEDLDSQQPELDTAAAVKSHQRPMRTK